MPLLTWSSKEFREPAPARLHTDSLIYPQGAGYPDQPPSGRLFYADNLALMAALLPEYENRVDLIYADPPFFTNRSYPARVGRGEDSRKPRDWRLAEGYPDSWPDLEAYLDMLYPRLVLMHRLLSPTGTLYLHLDWHANAYARVLLDEIFGPERLINEIVWVYHGPSPIRSAFNRKHDTILAYSKGKDYTFNVDAVREPYDPSTVKTFAASRKAGFGKIPDLERGKVPEDWWYFPVVARLHTERTGYPTQKPEALINRILLASSNPGDLVADFFSGSGTTAVRAALNGRRFLASDAAWRAVHTTRARLAAARLNTAFTVEADAGLLPLAQDLPAAEEPIVRCLPAAQAHKDGAILRLEAASLPELDYWEIDPDWDGKIFRSTAQACRPTGKKTPIPLELAVPIKKAGPQACLRLVAVNGACYQLPFNLQPDL